ncbi:DNA primase DnaG [Natronomonas pharaonis DSM 2160]|uniref:DNA primase DnaG n=1 Tax=Natronomonas pharaonis (strain ATCC 35678 / DSM 2160 / CIP 103997 / JCM 8858 / NBRC 14720 / NCIMB 2260 / Gabara) TaxID=348780 RepID=DNAG_NATPD|nr:DNA primase DnaG [Natronomonas pharaonis]Q3INE3.1 RecName: Full=DNA primase DnaG [Natronomonas pharaonis DSM 2160]CAI50360.1 DNA primase DnaG [Natronomonas pharaonis DSM 2160]
MQDTAKYLVHADITADGVVERSDVVGAVFGQTEGLLGDELDLRELQDASKVGRIDVEIDSENGQSFGRITIATSLDRVETAILGGALETIDRVGPCRSAIEVRKIEDVRSAKRREVVERAKSLLDGAFDESMRSSRDLVEEVRESVRVEDITDYEGLPAGPAVADSDAIVVVEGRADVLTLLQYGIKNAVAVEGTNVPEAVASLTETRTVTAFLDNDRGGELIRKELGQVGDIDYVATPPDGKCVEDLARHEVMSALREKVPYGRFKQAASDDADPEAAEQRTGEAAGATAADSEPAATDGIGGVTTDAEGKPVSSPESPAESPAADETAAVSAGTTPADAEEAAVDGATKTSTAGEEPNTPDDELTATSEAAEPGSAETKGESTAAEAPESSADGPAAAGASTDEQPKTLRGHVSDVIEAETGTFRLLDAEFAPLAAGDAGDVFEAVADAETVPAAVVVDGEASQRLLDIAAQRGIDHVVAASTGEFVKRPTSVRVRTATQLLNPEKA